VNQGFHGVAAEWLERSTICGATAGRLAPRDVKEQRDLWVHTTKGFLSRAEKLMCWMRLEGLERIGYCGQNVACIYFGVSHGFELCATAATNRQRNSPFALDLSSSLTKVPPNP
jgi:hypothetical protein